MFSFLRKSNNNSSSSSSSSDRSRAAPPPAAAARREKEQRWFNNLNSNGKQASHHPQPAHAHTNTSRLVPGGVGDSLQESPRAVEGLRAGAGAGGGASLKSRGSRIFSLGTSAHGPAGGDKQRKVSHGSLLSGTANGYAASAPNPHGRGGRTSPPPPPVPTSPPRRAATTTDEGTKSLATRLQELATSHADGLLDEEEYRLLRTELFERFASGPARAQEPSSESGHFPSLTKPPNHASSPSLLVSPPTSPQPEPAPSSSSFKSPRPPSFLSVASRNTTRSTSGFRSLFRRSTTALRADGSEAESDKWEMLDPDSPGPADRSPMTRSPHSSAGGYSPEVGAGRTLRHHPALASASLSPALSFTGASRSSFGHGTRAGSSLRSADSVRSGGAGSRIGNSLMSAASPTLLPPMASSRDPFLLAAADKEPTSTELRQEIEELERERRRLEDSWKSLERAAIAKQGGRMSPVAELDRPREAGSPSSAAAAAQNGNRMSTLIRKASFTKRPDSHVGTGLGLGGAGLSDGRLTPVGDTSSPRASPALQIGLSPPASPQRLGARASSPQLSTGGEGLFASSIPSQLLSQEDEPLSTADSSALAVEEVRRRRRATDERYEKRLEYLRARLRGALLKEGLR